MKHTLPKKSGRKTVLPDLSNFSQLRIPKDFIFLLLENLVNDLSQVPCGSGDAPLLSHPDIDLSQVKKAIRKRCLTSVLEATAIFDAQCISSNWSDQPAIGFGLYQLHTLLKKYPLTGAACEKAAYRSFLAYENTCRLQNTVNKRAIMRLNESHPDYLGIIEEIRADIVKCIGERPSMESVFANAKHGPGSTVDSLPGQVTSFFKWSTLPYTVSSSALPIAREAITTDPRWIGALIDSYRTTNNIEQTSPICMDKFWDWVFEVCDYCRYSTVPKSALTNRSIGIEPTLNVFLQLGVDGVIRHYLKTRWGIDLNTQEVNQLLAADASETDEDATIDLRGASDCVSLWAAYILLPAEWFALLLDLRSKNILIPKKFTGAEDEIIPLAKISAMGNGFTFVLESLIFAAIARTAMRRAKIKGNLAVYGDDIIVPVAAAPKVIDLLRLFGFETNVDKTFIQGPFRESCGVDCLKGINIRPFFLKKPVVETSDLWYIANSLFVLERRLPEDWEVSFQGTRQWIYQYIPHEYRGIVGPPSQSLDTYLFQERTRYDRNGVCKHMAVTPRARTFNNRALDWFFRKLMVAPKPSLSDSQVRLHTFHLSKIFGGACDLQSGWKTGGAVRDNQKTSASAFDVTLRGMVTKHVIIRQAWKS